MNDSVITKRTRRTRRSASKPPQTLNAYLIGPPRVSQRALADAVGCNQSMISMLRRGKRISVSFNYVIG